MSGMAGKVRRTTESDEFDLGNYDQARCDDLAKGAFTEPLPLKEMVRLSFVVGGGKLVRQKFSDDLPKIFMSSMSAVGYVDDSSASIESGSGGKYKFQHDTGKNLKFVHVFPRIAPPEAAPLGEDEEEEAEEEEEDELEGVPKDPAKVLFHCDDDEDFVDLLDEHVRSYTERKKFLELLKQRIQKLEEIEAKMVRGEQLAPAEQALFDAVGADDLKAKQKVLTAELQKMVDGGRLTGAEKRDFLEQLEEKLEAVAEQISKAEAEEKPKRAQALAQQREVMQKTRAAVKDASSSPLPRLRHHDQIVKLQKRLVFIARIEKEKKGVGYTVDDLKKMGEKGEIEEGISVLEGRSRGWFEEDDIFQARTQACIDEAKAAAKNVTRAAPKAGGGGYTAAGGKSSAKAKARR